MELISFGVFRNFKIVWRIVKRDGLYVYESQLMDLDYSYWNTHVKSDELALCLEYRNRDMRDCADEK